MLITIAQTTTHLGRLNGQTLSAFGLGGSTTAQYNSAISRALLSLSIQPSDITTPSDVDLAKIGKSDISKFLDFANYYSLEQILDNAEDVTEREGLNEQRWNERYAELRKRINNLRDRLELQYGFTLEPAAAKLNVGWLSK